MIRHLFKMKWWLTCNLYDTPFTVPNLKSDQFTISISTIGTFNWIWLIPFGGSDGSYIE